MFTMLIILGTLFAVFCLSANAVVMLGGGVTDIRGSIAGTTFSRSKSGNIARSRKKPVNPRSPLQITRRANAAWLATYWSKKLTEQQRTDWRAYATGTSWTNKLGQSITIGGNAAFMRLNTFALLTDIPIIAAAPTAMGHAGGVTIGFDAESDTSKIQIALPGGAFDKDVDFHRIALFLGIPTEPGRIATPKGFKYIGLLYGNLAAPMTFPVELDSAYTMRAGQLLTIRAMFKDEFDRMSGPFWSTATAAPA